MLKLAPRSDITAHIALFRQVSGLLAGASGLLGGLWISRLRDSDFGFEVGAYHFGSFQMLFVVSWFGRVIAAFWVLPITRFEHSDFKFVSDFMLRIYLVPKPELGNELKNSIFILCNFHFPVTMGKSML